MKVVTPMRVLIALLGVAIVVAVLKFDGSVFGLFSRELLCVRYSHNSALLNAIDRGNAAEVRRLVESGKSVYEEDSVKGDTPIGLALTKKRYDIAEYLVSKGLDLNKPSPKRKRTALNAFASRCDYKAIDWLVKKGADVNLEAANGSPLMNVTKHDECAGAGCEDKCATSAKLLVSRGANPNAGEKN